MNNQTKIYNLENPPHESYWTESAELDEYDLEEIKYFPPDAIFYWYCSGSYEGSGALIATKDGRWYTKDLSHCSCYGPMEDFASCIEEYKITLLDDILTMGSGEWVIEYAPLVELAKIHGYK